MKNMTSTIAPLYLCTTCEIDTLVLSAELESLASIQKQTKNGPHCVTLSWKLWDLEDSVLTSAVPTV